VGVTDPAPETAGPSLDDDDEDTDSDDYNWGFTDGYVIGRYEGALRYGEGRKHIHDVVKELAAWSGASVAEMEQTLADDCTYLEIWIEVCLEHGDSDTEIATEVGLPVKRVRDVIEREDLQRKADAARAKEGKPPSATVTATKPVTPPWCKPGKLEERAALLLQAIEAAGWKGMDKWNDITPSGLSETATNRGIDALIKLIH
jgi:hypothetical protein